MSKPLTDFIAEQRAAFDGIAQWVFSRGCLQQFPRIVFYLAKKNGGDGWEDSYQNLLIERICRSQWMTRHADTEFWTCTVDGSEWYRVSDEWRMMAYKEGLTETDESKLRSPSKPPLGAPTDGVIYWSNDFFRTVGYDQTGIPEIDLRGIVRYLTELVTGEYLEIEAPKQPKAEPIKRSWWRRLWSN